MLDAWREGTEAAPWTDVWRNTRDSYPWLRKIKKGCVDRVVSQTLILPVGLAHVAVTAGHAPWTETVDFELFGRLLSAR